MNIFDIIKNINLSGFITNANKTLNVVKKSIPVYKEIRPYIRHEKSLFKNKKVLEEDEIKMSKPLKENKTSSYNDSLTFFN